jgi:hydroxymethylpyrimidine pyrophosphatase-like HAD family hydrolase
MCMCSEPQNIMDRIIKKKGMSLVFDHVHDALSSVLLLIDAVKILGQERAAVFDIDDTVLFLTESEQWSRVEKTFALFRELQTRRFKIYFITARPHSQNNMDRTMKQLEQFGFRNFNGLFLMPSSGNIAHFKAVIRQFIRETQKVTTVLNIGNTWHDLLRPDIEHQLQATNKTYIFQGIGEEMFLCVKLPDKAIA